MANAHTQRLRLVGIAIAALALLKYVVILAEENFDVSRAPNVFLILLLPAFLGIALVPRKAGVILLGLFSLLFVALTVSAIVRLGFEQQNWSDALLVFLGAPISLFGVISAVGALRSSSSSPAPLDRSEPA